MYDLFGRLSQLDIDGARGRVARLRSDLARLREWFSAERIQHAILLKGMQRAMNEELAERRAARERDRKELAAGHDDLMQLYSAIELLYSQGECDDDHLPGSIRSLRAAIGDERAVVEDLKLVY